MLEILNPYLLGNNATTLSPGEVFKCFWGQPPTPLNLLYMDLFQPLQSIMKFLIYVH